MSENMNEGMSVEELFQMLAEAGTDFHVIWKFSEMDGETDAIPMAFWVEGMEEPITMGLIPPSVFTNMEVLFQDPEAQEVLGLNQIQDIEPDNLIDLNDYRED